MVGMGARKASYSQVISSTFLLVVVFWWSVANMEEREVKSADTGRYWGVRVGDLGLYECRTNN